MSAKVINSFKSEYIFNKYKDMIANDKFVYYLKNRYDLDKDTSIMITNRIRDYQVERFGDLLTYDNDFKTNEEIKRLSDNARGRKKSRMRRRT